MGCCCSTPIDERTPEEQTVSQLIYLHRQERRLLQAAQQARADMTMIAKVLRPDIFPSPVQHIREPSPEEAEKMKGKECVICMERAKDTVLLPCKHMQTCTTCTANIHTCPICRKAFAPHEVMRVFA